MAARGLARVEVEGLPTSVTSGVTLKPAVSIDLFTEKSIFWPRTPRRGQREHRGITDFRHPSMYRTMA